MADAKYRKLMDTYYSTTGSTAARADAASQLSSMYEQSGDSFHANLWKRLHSTALGKPTVSKTAARTPVAKSKSPIARPRSPRLASSPSRKRSA